jgi:hypothetical protein
MCYNQKPHDLKHLPRRSGTTRQPRGVWIVATPQAAATRSATLRLTLALGLVALSMFVALAGSARPLNAQTQNPTQRLLDIKRQQEQGLQPGTAPMQPGAAGAAAEGEMVAIEATGVASYYANDAARSRDEAIEAAQRQAVEQASGVIIQSETQMRNFDLVSDEVLSQSKGFIRSYDVVKEAQDGPFYNVTIRANVAKKAFIQNFENALESLYQRVGKPRVMLVVQEFEKSQAPTAEGAPAPPPDPALNVLEKEIRKILLKQGFTFIDARSLPKTRKAKADAGADAERGSLLEAARTSNAEIVMLGRGRVGAKSMLQKFNVVEASVGLDVIRADNGQVMASDVATGKGLHINEDTAAITALQKAADEITPKIMEQVTYQWIKEENEGQRIEMVVHNVTFGDVMNLRRALSNTVKGVRKVRQKSFGDGTAMLELESKDAPDRLAESLFETEFDGFKLQIEDVSATTLTVKLVKQP